MSNTEINIPDKKRERWEDLKNASLSEKKWTNERLTWLFTPQGVLFAALGITLSKVSSDTPDVLIHQLQIGITIIGITISVVVFISILAAAVMHRKWTSEMQQIAKQFPLSVTFGNKPYWPSSFARWAPVAMPVVFVTVWLWLFVLIIHLPRTA